MRAGRRSWPTPWPCCSRRRSTSSLATATPGATGGRARGAARRPGPLGHVSGLHRRHGAPQHRDLRRRAGRPAHASGLGVGDRRRRGGELHRRRPPGVSGARCGRPRAGQPQFRGTCAAGVSRCGAAMPGGCVTRAHRDLYALPPAGLCRSSQPGLCRVPRGTVRRGGVGRLGSGSLPRTRRDVQCVMAAVQARRQEAT